MSPEAVRRIDTALIWALILALIVVVSSWQYTSAQNNDEDTPAGDEPSAVTVFESSDGVVWLEIQHESEANYFVKISAILGFYQSPQSRGGSLRNEIIMQGRSIYTSMSMQEFERLLRTMGGVTEVGEVELDE